MRQNSGFGKLFLPISVTLFATVVAVSLFFGLFMNRTLVETVYESEARNLEQAGEATELLIRQASTIALQIHNDVQIKQLLFFDELDVFEQSLSMSQLKSFWQVVPQLHSIYLYNKPQETFFLATGARIQLVQPQGEFFDRQAVAFLRDVDVVNSGRPVAREIPGEEVSVYTFVFDFVRTVAAEASSTIFVNFDKEWLADRVNQLAFTADQSTYAIDATGRIVLSTRRAGPEEATLLAALELLKAQIDGSRNAQRGGYIVTNADGERALISAFFRPDLRWTFVRVTPLGSLLQSVVTTRRVVVAISIGFLIVSLVIAFLLSRRIYVPVNEALDRFSGLEQEAEQSRKVVNRQLLYSFLLQPGAGAQSPQFHSLSRLELEIDIDRPVITALFAPDRNSGDCGEEPRTGPSFDAEITLVRRVAEERGARCEVIDYRGTNLLAVIGARTSGEPAGEDCASLINEAADALAQELSVSFFVIYDPQPKHLVDAANSLPELEGALEYRLVLGPGAVVAMTEIVAREEQPFEVSPERIDEIVNAITSREFEKAKNGCSAIMRDAASTTPASVRNSAIRLIASINQAITTIEENTGSQFVVSFSALLRDAERCATVGELEGFFDSLIETVKRGMVRQQSRRNSEIVLAIKRITREQYDNRNLSSVLISEELGLSAPY
ncbi:MAG: cache domain-containing protein, partial [Spirochaetales bacterium]